MYTSYQEIEFLDPEFNPISSVLNQYTKILKNESSRWLSQLTKTQLNDECCNIKKTTKVNNLNCNQLNFKNIYNFINSINDIEYSDSDEDEFIFEQRQMIKNRSVAPIVQEIIRTDQISMVETHSGETQTPIVEMNSGETQTSIVDIHSGETQTPMVDIHSRETQTPIVEMHPGETQTPLVEMHSGETQTPMVEYTNQDTQIDINMSDASTEYDPSIIEFLNLGNQYNFNKRIEEFKN